MTLYQTRFWTKRVSGEETIGLYRWIQGDGFLLLDRWNRKTRKWEDWPALLEATGIGGYTDYETIGQADALQRYRDLGGIGEPWTLDEEERAGISRLFKEDRSPDHRGTGADDDDTGDKDTLK
jgi:hypothetical protein